MPKHNEQEKSLDQEVTGIEQKEERAISRNSFNPELKTERLRRKVGGGGKKQLADVETEQYTTRGKAVEKAKEKGIETFQHEYILFQSSDVGNDKSEPFLYGRYNFLNGHIGMGALDGGFKKSYLAKYDARKKELVFTMEAGVEGRLLVAEGATKLGQLGDVNFVIEAGTVTAMAKVDLKAGNGKLQGEAVIEAGVMAVSGKIEYTSPEIKLCGLVLRMECGGTVGDGLKVLEGGFIDVNLKNMKLKFGEQLGVFVGPGAAGYVRGEVGIDPLLPELIRENAERRYKEDKFLQDTLAKMRERKSLSIWESEYIQQASVLNVILAFIDGIRDCHSGKTPSKKPDPIHPCTAQSLRELLLSKDLMPEYFQRRIYDKSLLSSLPKKLEMPRYFERREYDMPPLSSSPGKVQIPENFRREESHTPSSPKKSENPGKIQQREANIPFLPGKLEMPGYFERRGCESPLSSSPGKVQIPENFRREESHTPSSPKKSQNPGKIQQEGGNTPSLPEKLEMPGYFERRGHDKSPLSSSPGNLKSSANPINGFDSDPALASSGIDEKEQVMESQRMHHPDQQHTFMMPEEKFNLGEHGGLDFDVGVENRGGEVSVDIRVPFIPSGDPVSITINVALAVIALSDVLIRGNKKKHIQREKKRTFKRYDRFSEGMTTLNSKIKRVGDADKSFGTDIYGLTNEAHDLTKKNLDNALYDIGKILKWRKKGLKGGDVSELQDAYSVNIDSLNHLLEQLESCKGQNKVAAMQLCMNVVSFCGDKLLDRFQEQDDLTDSSNAELYRSLKWLVLTSNVIPEAIRRYGMDDPSLKGMSKWQQIQPHLFKPDFFLQASEMMLGLYLGFHKKHNISEKIKNYVPKKIEKYVNASWVQSVSNGGQFILDCAQRGIASTTYQSIFVHTIPFLKNFPFREMWNTGNVPLGLSCCLSFTDIVYDTFKLINMWEFILQRYSKSEYRSENKVFIAASAVNRTNIPMALTIVGAAWGSRHIVTSLGAFGARKLGYDDIFTSEKKDSKERIETKYEKKEIKREEKLAKKFRRKHLLCEI